MSGYYTRARYADSTCVSLVYAESNLLNACNLVSAGKYVMYTATVNTITTMYHSDAACTTMPTTELISYTDKCTESYLTIVTSTGVPPSSAAMASNRYNINRHI